MPLVKSRFDDGGEMVVMAQKTLYVAFKGHQVAVCSNIPEVIELIERSFSKMLESESTRIVGRLEVFTEGEKYHLVGNITASEEYRSLGDILDNIHKEVIYQLIQANPELLWLHAGAAAYQDCAVVFPGAWGRGKSTIVTSLCENGWSYLSDDIVPIDLNSGKVIPFFRTPTIRKNSGQKMSLSSLEELQKLEIDLKQNRLCREPMPISGIIFPFYSHGSSARLVPYSPAVATLELLGSCMNYENHREGAVRQLCNLVKNLAVSRLYYSIGEQAAELIGSSTHEKWYCV
ncbi:MAG: hypothetical protein ACE5KZ_03280 [Candidatus Scalinduaceae bacterium]